MEYILRRTPNAPALDADWESNDWKSANIAEINNFRPESSDHRPKVLLKLQYDDDGIYGLFKVSDKYIRSIQTEFQSGVCKDSCVEFFVRPGTEKGYFNFEFNCGGTLLVYYIQDNERTPDGFRKSVKLNEKDRELIEIYHSMPSVVEPEIKEEKEWYLGFHIPFALFERYKNMDYKNIDGTEWRANFYKCGDGTSHPHWASWSPVSKLNFHLPECFGRIVFEK